MQADSLQRLRIQQSAPEFEPLTASFTDSTITERFDSIVSRYPGRLAVVDRNTSLTYEELARRSDHLAEDINGECGNLQHPIGLLLPQGVNAAVSILGALKAGMIYVPLDFASPEGSLREILSEVGPALVLTDEENMTLAGSVSPAGVTVMNVQDGGSSRSDGIQPERNGMADDFAYIFFTSGTTGRPKGVFDTHRNVLHNIMRYTNSLAIQPDDRLSLIQSPSFSGTVSSLFCALLNGACACTVDMRQETMGSLASWLREQAITIYHSVPAIFRAITENAGRFQSVRIVRLEGDRASKRDLERFKRHFASHALLVNGLGTTETGLVCQYFMDRKTQISGEVLPVGYQSEDMQVRIVGDDESELPRGNVGEIAVTSRYLASGYWGRDDLTATAFKVSNVDNGARTYLTGDLGRIGADGSLEHLGRADTKIRLRGQWIVPAIVEEMLTECRIVDEAAVTIVGDVGNERLIAYLKVGNEEDLDIRVLRQLLMSRLPAHCVPSRFIAIDDLPITATGKIDRLALPKPDRERPKLSTPYVAPYTAFQQRLTELWCDVLELDQVGVDDDFFELGGDSLLAVQMLTGLEMLVERMIRPDVLFESPTIERLANFVVHEDDTRESQQILNADGDLQPFFFLHGDYLSGGYYTLELARHLGPDRPVVPIRPCGVAGDPVPSTYQEMAKIHLDQIRAVQPTGPYLLGGNCNGGLIAFEMTKLLARNGEDVSRLVMIDASASNLKYRRLRDSFVLGVMATMDASLAERAFLWIRGQLEWMKQHEGSGRARLFYKRIARKLESILQDQASKHDKDMIGTTQKSISKVLVDLRRSYQRIDHLYFPGSYDGPIVLLWPKESRSEKLQDARFWWEPLCKQIEIREIPGNNTTCLTRHVGALAHAVEAALK